MGILSEAQSEFNNDKIIWCINYINKLRNTARVKIDELTANIFQVFNIVVIMINFLEY